MLKPVVMMLITLLSKEILQFVLETVTSLAETDLTNEEKRAEAFAMIKAKLSSDGMELRSSIVNLLIEWAVVQLNKAK